MTRRSFIAAGFALTIVGRLPQPVVAAAAPRNLFVECVNPRWDARIPNVNVAARLAGRRW